jgi:uncharacterized membrane protein YfcA
VYSKTDNPSVGYGLIPYFFKWAGGIFFVLGSFLAYLRFGLEINPKIFECKVFAVYSAYFKTRWFSVIDNNVTEELCGVLVLSGLFLIAFSKEKSEKLIYREFRFKALVLSLFISTLISIFSFIFIYGTAFLAALAFIIFLPLVLYNLLFYYMLFRNKNKEMLA